MNSLTPFIAHEMKNLPDETHGRAEPTDTKSEQSEQTVENHCIPCRQKNAVDFLAGNTPGVMASYSPDMNSAADEAALQPRAPTKTPRMHDLAAESEETVLGHVEWREEAPYG